jgi:SPP1 family predicted phage head-tail adaptor
MYQPGELDQKITIRRQTLVADGMGGAENSTTTLANAIWAHARPRSGKEIGAHDKVESALMYLFVIRYRGDLKEDDRITWNGEEYNIRVIKTRGARKTYLEIDAERGVTM